MTRWTFTFCFSLVSDLSEWHFIWLIGRSDALHFAVMLIVLHWSVRDVVSPFKVQSSPGENVVEFATKAAVASLLPLQLEAHCITFYQVLFFTWVAPPSHWMLLLLWGGLGLSSTEMLELLVSQLILAGMINFDRLNLKPCHGACFHTVPFTLKKGAVKIHHSSSSLLIGVINHHQRIGYNCNTTRRSYDWMDDFSFSLCFNMNI